MHDDDRYDGGGRVGGVGRLGRVGWRGAGGRSAQKSVESSGAGREVGAEEDVLGEPGECRVLQGCPNGLGKGRVVEPGAVPQERAGAARVELVGVRSSGDQRSPPGGEPRTDRARGGDVVRRGDRHGGGTQPMQHLGLGQIPGDDESPPQLTCPGGVLRDEVVVTRRGLSEREQPHVGEPLARLRRGGDGRATSCGPVGPRSTIEDVGHT